MASQNNTDSLRNLQCQTHVCKSLHETQKGVPPGTIGAYSRLTFWFLILPYIEQMAAYERIAGLNDSLGVDVEQPDGNSTNVERVRNTLPGNDQQERLEYARSLARISVYFCPARRAASGRLTNSSRPADLGSNANNRCRDDRWEKERWWFGPSSDYAIPAVMYNVDDANHHTGRTSIGDLVDARPLHHDILSGGQFSAAMNDWEKWASGERAPFPAAVHTTRDGNTNDARIAKSWRPRVDIGWWEDGTSNQLIVGEKYMLPQDMWDSHWDATWLWSHGDVIHGTYRVFHYYIPMARSNVREEWECHHSQKRFGSSHPGVVMFCFGDGSVRSIPTTAPLAITVPLCHVSDGNVVAVP